MTLAEDLIEGAEEAAEFTGLKVRAIYHLVSKSEIPFIRKGGKLYFRKSELESAFSAQQAA